MSELQPAQLWLPRQGKSVGRESRTGAPLAALAESHKLSPSLRLIDVLHLIRMLHTENSIFQVLLFSNEVRSEHAWCVGHVCAHQKPCLIKCYRPGPHVPGSSIWPSAQDLWERSSTRPVAYVNSFMEAALTVPLRKAVSDHEP